MIKEVVLADILFPTNFTDALEVTATKKQEFERIRRSTAIELEGAEAAQSKATAEGEVEIERAKAAGKVAEINAEAKKKRRLTSIAKAETKVRVLVRRAKSEAERQRRLAELDLEKAARLKGLEVKKRKELDDLAVARDRGTAKVYAANPAYAPFLVNEELALKVKIAVLPAGTVSGVLGNVIQGAIGPGKK